ncbi:hypothetical protein Bpfe_000369 [Biomphalaria pfeifferi]|uniref:Uncharacterized protein n=1 Tax=Biomphalaria pfeifferi TaxID=112525 RepID=A0AAD8FPL6_BIOPF|nr:hypothetical protein Bpfe_000369 [Biomphalaria pfeifferi]
MGTSGTNQRPAPDRSTQVISVSKRAVRRPDLRMTKPRDLDIRRGPWRPTSTDDAVRGKMEFLSVGPASLAQFFF